MNELRNLLPRDKHDVESVNAIAKLGYPTIAPIIPDLLEWMQDMDWPVAKAVRPVLAKIGEPLLPGIRYVLASGDEIWKYWVLATLVADSQELRTALRPELQRLSCQRTPTEDAEEVRAVAAQLLSTL